MATKRHDRFSWWLCASCETSCNCYHHCYHRLRRTGSAGGGGLRRRASAGVAAVGDEEESYYPSVVRTVLAGGVVELYSAAVPAREVMERHPGLCVARPEVFSSPEEALVGPKEKLLPGEKFYLIPYTTVRKLKQRRRRAEGGGAGAGGAAHLVDLKAAMAADKGGAEEAEDEEEEKVLSANDFYVSRERWRQCGARRRLLWEAGRRVSEGPTPTSIPTSTPTPPPPPPPPPPPLQVGRGAGRGFVPPRRRKMCRKKGTLGWRPNLESIQEVSA